VWRTIVDLNRAVMYADLTGDLQETPARRMFCIVDGIIGGQGNGPMDPIPKAAGVVVAGMNPVAVEHVCASIMGFGCPLRNWNALGISFKPHFGWQGQVEMNRP